MHRKKTIERRTYPQDITQRLGTNAILDRVFKSRGVQAADELELQTRHLLTPDNLSNVDLAAGLLAQLVVSQGRLVIVGDYDTDGATSVALCVLALRAMGMEQVDYVVPNRFEYGYGLSPAIVDVAATLEPDCLITVDNGIASHAGVIRAHELGIQVIVTDHHLPGETLPEADAIVNPNLAEDGFSSKNLAGVGVVFYVLSVTRKLLQHQGWFGSQGPPNLAEFLDLVALGTYADLVPLDHNNRILVNQGIRRINHGKCRPGIQALIEVSGKSAATLTASDLGFQLAPRLNAAGRLDDISVGIECLLSQDCASAKRLACHLDEMNRQRKEIEHDMQEQGIRQAVESVVDNKKLGICLYNSEWHQGIVGLVASRIKERLNRPAIIFAPGDGDELKGSARSVTGLHMRDLLCEVDSRHPTLISKFGGHAMAAGLSIAEADYPRFKEVVEIVLQQHADTILDANKIVTDGELGEEIDDLGFIHEIKSAAPWGQGFPEPLFDNLFRVIDQRIVGDIHLKLKLQLEVSGSRYIDAICFRYLDARGAPCPDLQRIRAAYRLDINEYAGRIQPQLIISYLEPM